MTTHLRPLAATLLALAAFCTAGTQAAVAAPHESPSPDTAALRLEDIRRDLQDATADAIEAALTPAPAAAPSAAALTCAVAGAGEILRDGDGADMRAAVEALREETRTLQAARARYEQARRTLDRASQAARDTLASTKGRVDDDAPRIRLSDLTSQADAPADADAMQALAARLDAARTDAEKAAEAHDARIAAEQAAAAQAAAQAAARPAATWTPAAHAASTPAVPTFTAGDCRSVNECQAALADGSMQAYHMAGGSTYYGVHDIASQGLWGSTQVVIDGATLDVGAWRAAEIIDGEPYAPDDGGTYVQTCHNGQVWYAPVA